MKNQQVTLISYQNLRKSIGFLGITLPFILLLGNYFIDHCGLIQISISHYYHSIMRDVFVGIICGVALFMFAYYGYDKQDKIAAKIASFSAMGIAFFPTQAAENSLFCSSRFVAISDLSTKLHYFSAAVFFLTLSYFCLVLFRKGNPNPTSQKSKRNFIYLICGFLILICLLLIAIYQFSGPHSSQIADLKPVFWLESLALIAFGVSWLIKGEAILGD
jgi:hypothetical protein